MNTNNINPSEPSFDNPSFQMPKFSPPDLDSPKPAKVTMPTESSKGPLIKPLALGAPSPSPLGPTRAVQEKMFYRAMALGIVMQCNQQSQKANEEMKQTMKKIAEGE